MFSSIATHNPHLQQHEQRSRNDENEILPSMNGKKMSSKSSTFGSSFVDKTPTAKGLKTPGGKQQSTTKRRVLGDISNRKQTNTSIQRLDGKPASVKPQPLQAQQTVKAKNGTKNLSKSVSFDLVTRKQLESNGHVRDLKQQSLPRMQQILSNKREAFDDVDDVELPAGRLYGQGPNTFFDPVCSFDLDDDDEDPWRVAANTYLSEREREIRDNDKRLNEKIEKLYEDDSRALMNGLVDSHKLEDILFDDFDMTEEGRTPSWGYRVRLDDDDISL